MNELQNFEYLKFQHEKENLPDVFGTVLDTFPHITGATVTGQIYLWDVLQRIKYNLAFDIEPETYLLNKYVNGIRNAIYDGKKEQLPAICFNARFNGYKDTKHLKSVTNLMFLDIDDFPTREEAIKYKQKIINKYDWIIACNLSLSKIGLHVIALVDAIKNNDDYNDKYDFISSTYFDGLLDKSSKSLTRYTVVPFDYDIYINESPSVLNIDKIINENKKGIHSAYIQNKELTDSSINEKGIRSVYNTDNHLISLNSEKGIRSVYIPFTPEEKIICTPYTFSSDSSLELKMNDSERKHNLRFRQDIDESNFEDPNIPIYVREGVDIIEVNTFQYKYRKVNEGHRHDFIGLYTLKMILLNAGSPDNNHKDIRRDILKLIQHLNKTYCEPPLTYDEVIKSYNANWRRFKEGKINFTNFYTKKRAFWSKQSTLTANEKRCVTCKIKNEPIVKETKRRIWKAIEILNAERQKITQPQVASVSGLSLSTVKKYRKEFHEFKNMLNPALDILEIDENNVVVPEETNFITDRDANLNSDNPNQDIDNNFFELIDSDNIEFVEAETINVSATEKTDSTTEYSETQLQLCYQRIFNSLQNKLDESTNLRLYKEFLDCFHQLPTDNAKLLITPLENITDSETYWKQSTLESKIWSLCTEIIS